MNAFARVAVLSATATIGWATAEFRDLEGFDQSSGYLYFVTSLLALGIYGCTRGILISELKDNARVVFLAITLGVLMKAALISAIVVGAFRNPDYAILGVVVAQIDPLSVSAMRAKTRMSDSAKAMLSAWSSFDDPMTVLLTIYVAAFALQAQGGGSAADGALFGGGLQSFGVNLAVNLLFAGCFYVMWKLARLGEQRFGERSAAVHGRAAMPSRQAVALLALLAVGAVAVANALILGLALIGLFFRPAIGEAVERMTQVALLVATFALGLLLVDGVEPVPGLVLGGAAYGAQVAIAPLLTRRQPCCDRVYLALGQQNGVTAIALALLLEPTLPGTVAIIAPAILVTNLLHAICNGVWHRVERTPAAEEHNGNELATPPPLLHDAQAVPDQQRHPAPSQDLT